MLIFVLFFPLIILGSITQNVFILLNNAPELFGWQNNKFIIPARTIYFDSAGETDGLTIENVETIRTLVKNRNANLGFENWTSIVSFVIHILQPKNIISTRARAVYNDLFIHVPMVPVFFGSQKTHPDSQDLKKPMPHEINVPYLLLKALEETSNQVEIDDVDNFFLIVKEKFDMLKKEGKKSTPSQKNSLFKIKNIEKFTPGNTIYYESVFASGYRQIYWVQDETEKIIQKLKSGETIFFTNLNAIKNYIYFNIGYTDNHDLNKRQMLFDFCNRLSQRPPYNYAHYIFKPEDREIIDLLEILEKIYNNTLTNDEDLKLDLDKITNQKSDVIIEENNIQTPQTQINSNQKEEDPLNPQKIKKQNSQTNTTLNNTNSGTEKKELQIKKIQSQDLLKEKNETIKQAYPQKLVISDYTIRTTQGKDLASNPSSTGRQISRKTSSKNKSKKSLIDNHDTQNPKPKPSNFFSKNRLNIICFSLFGLFCITMAIKKSFAFYNQR